MSFPLKVGAYNDPIHCELSCDTLDRDGLAPIDWAAFWGEDDTVINLLSRGSSPHSALTISITKKNWRLAARIVNLTVSLPKSHDIKASPYYHALLRCPDHPLCSRIREISDEQEAARIEETLFEAKLALDCMSDNSKIPYTQAADLWTRCLVKEPSWIKDVIEASLQSDAVQNSLRLSRGQWVLLQPNDTQKITLLRGPYRFQIGSEAGDVIRCSLDVRDLASSSTGCLRLNRLLRWGPSQPTTSWIVAIARAIFVMELIEEVPFERFEKEEQNELPRALIPHMFIRVSHLNIKLFSSLLETEVPRTLLPILSKGLLGFDIELSRPIGISNEQKEYFLERTYLLALKIHNLSH